MTTETTEHRISRLEGAYDQMDKRLTEQRQNTENQSGELSEEIRGFRIEMREDNQALRGEIHDLRTEMREDNHSLRTEMREDNHSLRTEMREDNHSLRTEFNARLDRITNIMIGGIIAVVGAVTASIVVNLINS